ncbi:hypothetical protein KCP75_12005 [Salmonella enterica subsp. enterica]|nr:hypothetical protein KCP75_12005 [Salmonella enterica subsp. enterica]
MQARDAAIFSPPDDGTPSLKRCCSRLRLPVLLACHHEQNIFKMGGLRKSIPLVCLLPR